MGLRQRLREVHVEPALLAFLANVSVPGDRPSENIRLGDTADALITAVAVTITISRWCCNTRLPSLNVPTDAAANGAPRQVVTEYAPLAVAA